MDSSDPLYWLIFLLTALIAVLALGDPWGRELWDDDEEAPLPHEEEPRRQA
jgi:hypothetical protein